MHFYFDVLFTWKTTEKSKVFCVWNLPVSTIQSALHFNVSALSHHQQLRTVKYNPEIFLSLLKEMSHPIGCLLMLFVSNLCFHFLFLVYFPLNQILFGSKITSAGRDLSLHSEPHSFSPPNLDITYFSRLDARRAPFPEYRRVYLISGEVLFLAWGIRVCYNVRNAESLYNEARLITYAIYNIAIVNIMMIAFQWVPNIQRRPVRIWGARILQNWNEIFPKC